MDTSGNEQTSNLTSNPTSSSIPISQEATSKPIQIPVSKQANQTNWLGVSNSDFFVGSPRSGEALKAGLGCREKMMQPDNKLSISLPNNTAGQTTSPQNQDEVKPQGNPDLHNSDTPEAPDVFGGMEL